MISRTLIRLIDQAIVPAITLLCARVTSVILLSYFFGVGFAIDSTGFVFENQQDYLFVNSYSTLTMIAVLAVGIIYILIKAFIFHDTHISPHLTAKVFHYKVATLIQSSFELYSQGVIWLSYLYLISIVTVILSFTGLIYSWVAWTGGILSFLATTLLIFDVENEIDLKSSEGEYIEDDTPVEISMEGKK